MGARPVTPRRWRLVLAAAAATMLLPAATAGPAQAETVNITIANLAFSPPAQPALLTGGEPGFTSPHAHVFWTNNDSTDHTVTFDDPRQVSSEHLRPGQRYEIVSYTPGTFTYHCSIHPQMTGSLVITPGPPEPPTSVAAAPGVRTDGSTSGGSPSNGSGSGSAALPIVLGLLVGSAALVAVLVWRRQQASPAGRSDA